LCAVVLGEGTVHMGQHTVAAAQQIYGHGCDHLVMDKNQS
jgi:hypothetical protein